MGRQKPSGMNVTVHERAGVDPRMREYYENCAVVPKWPFYDEWERVRKEKDAERQAMEKGKE